MTNDDDLNTDPDAGFTPEQIASFEAAVGVEQWKADLSAAGWVAESATAWRAPDGSLWRGPFGAWKELQRRAPSALPDWNITADESLLNNWPIPDVLNRLAEAATHLLSDHNCDAHGYEELQHAVVAARAHASRASVAAPPPDEDQPCPDPRCNDHLGASPIPQCVTAVYWSEEASAIADVVRELSEQFNRIDNGHCTICRRFRLYDTRGKMQPCENAECQSHRISVILNNHEKPSAETLERMKQRCLERLRAPSPVAATVDAETLAKDPRPESHQHDPLCDRWSQKKGAQHLYDPSRPCTCARMPAARRAAEAISIKVSDAIGTALHRAAISNIAFEAILAGEKELD